MVVWQTAGMHLLPADRAGHRVIDSERVCHAIASLGDPEVDPHPGPALCRARRPTRLTLLTCISAAGPISVSDLAAATGLLDTTVSQALRYLRAAQIVSASATAGSSATCSPTTQSAPSSRGTRNPLPRLILGCPGVRSLIGAIR